MANELAVEGTDKGREGVLSWQAFIQTPEAKRIYEDTSIKLRRAFEAWRKHPTRKASKKRV